MLADMLQSLPDMLQGAVDRREKRILPANVPAEEDVTFLRFVLGIAY